MKKFKYYTQTNGWQEVIAETEPLVCHIDGSRTIGVHISDENPLVAGGVHLDSNLSLANYKQLRYNEIDAKTGDLISAGFTFDSQTFSLSTHAQNNWNALKVSTEEFTFPLDISTIGSNTYEIAEIDVNNFWLSAMGTIKSHYDSGRALKKTIFDSTTVAQISAVIDNR